MSGRPQSADDAVSEPRAPSIDPGQPGPADPPALELALVRYADRPDRCTVHPPDATGVERMSTWISVDRSLVVDAASMR
ncbi:DUF7511 domain-containing protein [Halosimplex halophilum]|uniref:DUF7511 domain-containing protein n=1 Tax=Halosimplex halophilum TaxID=2559572 RepID=UPI00107F51CB|nr:hypothetical protein [Halosimplex halophilum]